MAPAAYPAGIQQKILASDLDEKRKMSSRTRLLRFEPGVYTTAPFLHDHWEEVYLLSGDLTVGNDEHDRGKRRRLSCCCLDLPQCRMTDNLLGHTNRKRAEQVTTHDSR